MRARRRTSVLVASVVLALGAGPLAVPALAASAPAAAHSTTSTSTTGLDTKALKAALKGLPDDDATAALVRVGGTDGTWRGSAGVHDLESRRAADPDARFRSGSTTKVVTAAVVRPCSTTSRGCSPGTSSRSPYGSR